MPYEILWEARGVVKRHHGFLAADELLAASREIQSDPRFDDLRYIINDFLDVEAMPSIVRRSSTSRACGSGPRRSTGRCSLLCRDP